MKHVILLLFAAGIAMMFGGGDNATPYDKAVQSAVWLEAGEGHGSGVVIAPGLILTAYHVIEGCENQVWAHAPVRQDGAVISSPAHYRRGDAQRCAVIATDPARDLALLKIGGKWGKPMALASKRPSPGSAVFTIGNGDCLFRFASGHVRSVGFATAPFPGHDVAARMVSNSVPLNIGDSGGALVDGDGRLVGINSYIEIDKYAVNNAIDVSEIRTFLEGVKR